jgi:hypothetical protein
VRKVARISFVIPEHGSEAEGIAEPPATAYDSERTGMAQHHVHSEDKAIHTGSRFAVLLSAELVVGEASGREVRQDTLL